MSARTRAAGLLLGTLADRVLPDPRRGHPVAGFGLLAGALERRTHARSRPRGVLHVALLVGGTTGVGVLVERATRDRAGAHLLATAAATWVVLGGASLEREAHAVGDLLAAGDLTAARRRVTHLVGRDPSSLDPDGVARAVVESVAENTSDAVVAPLLLGGLGGVPALLGYRAANTLDAMVGHRSARYERFGWAAARLDDLLNLPGARLAALLATAVGDDPRGALAAWRRDAGNHPSPNAGPVEAAFAGALGVRLGGTTTYGTGADARVEHRPVLGTGRAAGPADVRRATALARRVDLGAVLVSALVPALVLGPARAAARARRPRGAPRRRRPPRAG